jgi:hypothetical protein
VGHSSHVRPFGITTGLWDQAVLVKHPFSRSFAFMSDRSDAVIAARFVSCVPQFEQSWTIGPGLERPRELLIRPIPGG